MGQFTCSTAFFDSQDPYPMMAKECQCDSIAKVLSGDIDGSCPPGTDRVPNEDCNALAHSTLSDGTKLEAYKGNRCDRVAGTGCWYNAHRVVRGGQSCAGVKPGNDNYAICQQDVETMCSCDTPNAGTVGDNMYQCNDGSSGQCSGNEVCYSVVPFAKSKSGLGCQLPACTCTTQDSGAGGHNKFECNDGSFGYCPGNQVCYATVPFPQHELKRGCRTPKVLASPVHEIEVIRGPKSLGQSCDAVLFAYCQAANCGTCATRRRHGRQPHPYNSCKWIHDLFCCQPSCANQAR